MKRLLFIMPLFFILLVFTGCDEAGTMMKPVVADDPADIAPTTTVGEVKQPEPEETEVTDPEPTTPEPTEPTDTEPPTVTGVAFYSDWQLTEEITAASVHPGDTVYTKVVFSEPVQHIVADDETARPALSFVLDGQATRYTIAAHGASGKDFLSGVCKPFGSGVDDYLCKVVIPADTTGTFALQVEAETADPADNTAAESLHIASFTVAEPEPMEPEPEPPVEEPVEPEPILVIEIAIPMNNGAIAVYGTSSNLPADTIVTVVIEDITAITVIREGGRWNVTIPAAEAEHLTGRVTATASAAGTLDSTSFTVTGEITLVEVGSEYTFTLEGETYPGYNPSPEVQRILDTHPSAQLPHFEEAVKMEEVVDWVYRKVWDVYPDSVDKRVAARRRVKGQFGLTKAIDDTLFSEYFDFLGGHPESRYWFSVECFRLLMQHTEQLRTEYPALEYYAVWDQFKISLEKGYIVGQTNPND